MRYWLFVLVFVLFASVLAGLVVGGWDNATHPMTWGARFVLYNCSGGGVVGYRYDDTAGKMWFIVVDVLSKEPASCDVEWVKNKTGYWLENHPDPGRFNPFVPANISYLPWAQYNISVGGVVFHVWAPKPYPDTREFAEKILGFLETHKAQILGAGAFDNVVEYLKHLLETIYRGYATGYQLIIIPLDEKVYPKANDYLAILTLDPVPPNTPTPTITITPREIGVPKWINFYSSTIEIRAMYQSVGPSAVWVSGIGSMDWYGRKYVVSARLLPWLWLWKTGMVTKCLWIHECNAPLNPPSFMLWTTDYDEKGWSLTRKYTSWLQVPLHYSSHNLPLLLRNMLSYPWILARYTGGSIGSGRLDSLIVASSSLANRSEIVHPDIYILNIEDYYDGPHTTEIPLTIDFLGLRLNATLNIDPYLTASSNESWPEINMYLVFKNPPFLAGHPSSRLARLLVEKGFLENYTSVDRTKYRITGMGGLYDRLVLRLLGLASKNSDYEEIVKFTVENNLTILLQIIPKGGSLGIIEEENRTAIIGFGRNIMPYKSSYVDVYLLVGYYHNKSMGSLEGLVWLGPVARIYFDSGALLRGDLSSVLRVVNYYVFNETCLREHGFPGETRYAPRECLVPAPMDKRVPVEPVYHVAGNASTRLVYVEKPARTPVNISNATIPVPTTINGTHTIVNVTANLETIDYEKIAPLATGAITVTLAIIVLATSKKKKKQEEDEKKKTLIDELEEI